MAEREGRDEFVPFAKAARRLGWTDEDFRRMLAARGAPAPPPEGFPGQDPPPDAAPEGPTPGAPAGAGGGGPPEPPQPPELPGGGGPEGDEPPGPPDPTALGAGPEAAAPEPPGRPAWAAVPELVRADPSLLRPSRRGRDPFGDDDGEWPEEDEGDFVLTPEPREPPGPNPFPPIQGDPFPPFSPLSGPPGWQPPPEPPPPPPPPPPPRTPAAEAAPAPAVPWPAPAAGGPASWAAVPEMAFADPGLLTPERGEEIDDEADAIRGLDEAMRALTEALNAVSRAPPGEEAAEAAADLDKAFAAMRGWADDWTNAALAGPQRVREAAEGLQEQEEALGSDYTRAGAGRRGKARRRLGMRALGAFGLDRPFAAAYGLAQDVYQSFAPDSPEERKAAGLPARGESAAADGLNREELREIIRLLEQMVQQQTNDGSSVAERNLAEGTPMPAELPAAAGDASASRSSPEASPSFGGGLVSELRRALGGGPRRPGTPVPGPGGRGPVPPGRPGAPGAPPARPPGGGDGIWDLLFRVLMRGRGGR